jgi:hypothetical protein
MVEHIEHCSLGCFSDGSRCGQLAPSNGLGLALDQSEQYGAVTLPAGSVIDTDTGAVAAAGTPIVVATVTIAQPGGPVLRVLLARSWSISDARIRGSLPLAIVASDEITVQGVVDVSADASQGGAGSLVCGSGAGGGGAAQGFFERPPASSSPGYPGFLWASNGFGGGGFGTTGGAGGTVNASLLVGTAGQENGNVELVPLRGGCEGGGDSPPHRGAGGGAIQLVAGRIVHVVAGGGATGIVHVGGGGGLAGVLGRVDETDTAPVWGPEGGGSGGGILIEAPNVVFDDGIALLAAGGAAGGYGACGAVVNGSDAAPNAAVPAGGRCPAGTTPTAAGGDGATNGTGGSGQATSVGSAGGGGGGLGRIRINTGDGQYSAGASALLRGVVTTGVVGRR